MSTLTIIAEKRDGKGKNYCNRVREKGYIPAVVYSHGTSMPIIIDEKGFFKAFKGRISESKIIELDVKNDEKTQVYVKDYQLDPVTDKVIHLDFYKITANEKIRTMVPLEFVGIAIGTKMGGIFELVERELEVEVLPKDLPEKFVIDITKLEVNQSITIKDIPVPESLTFIADSNHVVAHVVVLKVSDEDKESSAAESTDTKA